MKCPGCGYRYPDGCDATCDYKHPMQEWISVKDRLPPKDISVLCYYCDQYMDVMEYWFDDEETGRPTFFFPPSPPTDRVTHWMPLPSAPKET